MEKRKQILRIMEEKMPYHSDIISLEQAFPDEKERERALKLLRQEYENYFTEGDLPFVRDYGWIEFSIEDVTDFQTRVKYPNTITAFLCLITMDDQHPDAMVYYGTTRQYTDEQIRSFADGHTSEDTYLAKHEKEIDRHCERYWNEMSELESALTDTPIEKRREEVQRIIGRPENRWKKLNSVSVFHNKGNHEPFYVSNTYLKREKTALMKQELTSRPTYGTQKLFLSNRVVEANHVGRFSSRGSGAGVSALCWIDGKWTNPW